MTERASLPASQWGWHSRNLCALFQVPQRALATAVEVAQVALAAALTFPAQHPAGHARRGPAWCRDAAGLTVQVSAREGVASARSFSTVISWSRCQQRRVGTLKLPTPAQACAVHAWGDTAHAFPSCRRHDDCTVNNRTAIFEFPSAPTKRALDNTRGKRCRQSPSAHVSDAA